MKKIKLIIDIDEQTYKAVQLHPECFNFAHAILNSKPLQAELEEIKDKIQKMPNANPSYYYTVDVVDRYDVLELLEDRIKELNNETSN